MKAICFIFICTPFVTFADEWSDKRDAGRAAAQQRGMETEANAMQKRTKLLQPVTIQPQQANPPPPATQAQIEFDQERFTRIYKASCDEVARVYPQATVRGSAIYNCMSNYDQWLKKTHDPLFDNPEKPMIIARQAAQWVAEGFAGPISKEPPRVQPYGGDIDYSLFEGPAARDHAARQAATPVITPHTVPTLPIPIDTGEIEVKIRGGFADFSNGQTTFARRDATGRGTVVDISQGAASGTQDIIIPDAERGHVIMPDGMSARYRRVGDKVIIEK